jgi:hypothetical protein
MKRLMAFAASALFAFVLCAAVQAGEGEGAQAKEFKGEVGCAHCTWAKATGAKGCGAAFKVGEDVYTLQAGEKASDELKNQIKNYKKEMKGNWTVNGTLKEEGGKKVLLAESAKKAE